MTAAPVRLPYMQALWKITTGPISKTPARIPTKEQQPQSVSGTRNKSSNDGGGVTSTKEAMKKRHLREAILLNHSEVIDLSPEDFWARHVKAVNSNAGELEFVTLVTGCLERDRVEDKSCALYLPGKKN
jgi:hypothetical protein